MHFALVVPLRVWDRRQVFRAFEEQPAVALDERPGVVLKCPAEVAADLVDFSVHQLDHMERVEHQVGFREMFAHGGDVGVRHVHRHGANLAFAAAQALPEILEGVGALAPTDVNDGAGGQVEDEGVVFGLAPGVELVNGDGGDVLERRLVVEALEAGFVDVFYQVPADAEVLGDVVDVAKFQEVVGVTLKAFGVGLPGFGEADGALSVVAASATDDALDVKDGEDLFTSDGE